MSLLDRDAAARTLPEPFAAIESNSAARVLLARGGQLAFAGGRPVALPVSAAPEGRRVYLGILQAEALGLSARTPLELRVLPVDAAIDLEFSLDVRRAVHDLAETDLELALAALALGNWLDTHHFCSACAGRLDSRHAGWALECVDCGRQVFPRIDPAIIVLVTDANDRVLLGSNAMWEQRRFSLLAGFVEPGETLEQAVAREVFEEAGIRVVEPRYLASQSWPFPASLMLGFAARAVDTATTPDGEEILEVRWLSREQLAGAEVLLPGRASIAHRLLREWYGAPLPEAS